MTTSKVTQWLFAGLFVFGLGLLINATVVGAFDIGGSRYQYDAIDGSIDNGTVRFQGQTSYEQQLYRDSEEPTATVSEKITPDDIEAVSCWYEYDERLCTIEADLLESQDGAGAEKPPSGDGGASVVPDDVPEYVHLDGEFYLRIALSEGGLRHVEPRAMLEDIALDSAAMSKPARRAVETGSVTTHRPLAENGQIFEVNGTYVAISGWQVSGTDFPLVVLSRGLQILLGVVALRRGWRFLWDSHWQQQLPGNNTP